MNRVSGIARIAAVGDSGHDAISADIVGGAHEILSRDML